MDLEFSPDELPAPEPKPVPKPTARHSPSKRDLLLVACAVAGGALVTLGLMIFRGAPASALAIEPDTSAVSHEGAPKVLDVPGWAEAGRGVWLGPRQRGIAYEVAAAEPVAVWMRTVHPLLVVRCTSGSLEAFVVTHTPARMEARTDDHTITYRLDEGSPVTEQWPDSADHDALFAPNGGAFAARLRAARTLEFGFTPHNAAPVIARFKVAGLAELLEARAKDCGVKHAVPGRVREPAR